MADEKIRVLIVDDIAETRENIRKLLQFEPDIEVVDGARNGQEGIQMAIDHLPDVVLMDINMPDMDGISATEAIRAKVPYTQIIILSVQSDPNYMRRAMLAGARDFLTKPPDIDELTAAIRRAGEMASTEKSKVVSVAASPISVRDATGQLISSGGFNGKIVTVYSPKGGNGTTTITVNLAVTMQSADPPVAAIDAKLQFGDLSFFFDTQGRNNIVDLAAADVDLEIFEDVVLEHADSGVKIIAAPQRPEYADSVQGEQFVNVLHFMRKMFNYVIVDTPSILTDVALSALDTSDIIILITTQDIPSIKNARLFLDLADALGIEREKILLVMNKYDKRRTNITPEKVQDNFKHEFTCVIPADERLVVPAMDRGVPFMLQNKNHPISRAIITLAQGVRTKAKELNEMEFESI